VRNILTGKLAPQQDKYGERSLDLGWVVVEVGPDESTEKLACRVIEEFRELGIKLPCSAEDRLFTDEEKERAREALPPAEEELEPATTPPTGIPLMLTHAMKAALRALGYTEEKILHLTPEQGHKILSKPNTATTPPAEEPNTAPAKPRSNSQPNPRLVAALDYAERDWDVFPAPPGEKKSYKSAEHSGGAKWGKTRDPKQIKKDFRKWPDANVGIPTGADNGIWVLETDTPKGHNVDGEASLRALEEKHGPLPETLMAESPSGSRHRYFKRPDAVTITNSTSSIGPGIDVRGEGGMVIAPPSARDDGAYRWLNDNPIADAPQWLINLAVGKNAHDADLGLARKDGGGNSSEDPNRLKVAEGFGKLDP